MNYSIVPNVSVYLPNTFRITIILIPVRVTTKMDAKQVAYFYAHARNERNVYKSPNFVER